MPATGCARGQGDDGVLGYGLEQAESDQRRREPGPDHRVVTQWRIGEIRDFDDGRTQPHLLAVGQRGDLFAPLDAEPAFRRHDAFHSEDLQLIAVVGMRQRSAVRAVSLDADANDHVRRRLVGHRDVMIANGAIHAGRRRGMRRCRRQSPSVVGVAGRTGLRIRSRPASEFRILEPEKRPAVVEHLVPERKQFGLFCVERRDRMQICGAACVIVAEASTRQRLLRDIGSSPAEMPVPASAAGMQPELVSADLCIAV